MSIDEKALTTVAIQTNTQPSDCRYIIEAYEMAKLNNADPSWVERYYLPKGHPDHPFTAHQPVDSSYELREAALHDKAWSDGARAGWSAALSKDAKYDYPPSSWERMREEALTVLKSAPKQQPVNEAISYLLSQLREVQGPRKTIMWESPDGFGGQFGDKSVALRCWIDRAISAAPIKREMGVHETNIEVVARLTDEESKELNEYYGKQKL